jgi:hypothetical protein
MLRAFRGPLLLPLLLTVSSLGAQTRPTFQAGAHGGFDFTNGEVDNERIGVQASVPVGWLLTVNPVFSYLYNFPGDPTDTFEGSAWQGYLTLRVHPLPFLALGYGMTVIHASLSSAEFDFSDSETDATDVGVVGLTLPTGRVRPFAELYLVDLLERRSAVGGHLLFGVNLRLP